MPCGVNCKFDAYAKTAGITNTVMASTNFLIMRTLYCTAWISTTSVTFIAAKGKVESNQYRAYGYEPPGQRIAEAKLAWRDLRMRFGKAPKGSSPRIQDELELNKDVTLKLLGQKDLLRITKRFLMSEELMFSLSGPALKLEPTYRKRA